MIRGTTQEIVFKVDEDLTAANVRVVFKQSIVGQNATAYGCKFCHLRTDENIRFD